MSDESSQENAGSGKRGWSWLWKSGLVLLGLTVAFGLFGPTLVARGLNRVTGTEPVKVESTVEELHRGLVIADLHADPLLWDRDLARRGTYGHVDVPRLIEGNVAVQGFSIVTKVPNFPSFEDNGVPSDVLIRALVMAQGWPRKTWNSMLERALYQCQRLEEVAARSKGQLRVIRTRAELDAYLKERQGGAALTAGFLAVEGAHCLEGELANVEVLFKAGVRMMSPTHFFDTKLGGSAHGISDGGLTEFGRQCLTRMEELGMVIDVSHASPALIRDVCAMATHPVVSSHTGVRGAFNSARNISDESVRAIAKTGGVVGIGFFKHATGGEDIAAIVRSIKHVSGLVGVDHVGLGSDFDGSVATPFHVGDLVKLTSALKEAGYSEEDLGKIMGGNVIRVLRAGLPK